MSSPPSPSETGSRGSYHASSQQATGTATADTASSVHGGIVAFGSSATKSCVAPNSAFTRWSALARSHSVSPALRRSLSPLGVLVVQQCVQLAEQVAESAMSGVGRVADEVRSARMEARVATTQAKSAKETMRTQTASFFVQVEASAEQVAEQMEGRLQALASHTKAQTL